VPPRQAVISANSPTDTTDGTPQDRDLDDGAAEAGGAAASSSAEQLLRPKLPLSLESLDQIVGSLRLRKPRFKLT